MAIITTDDNKGLYSDSSMFPVEDVLSDALVLTQSTKGPTIEGDEPVMHIPFVADNPEAKVYAEGDTIDDTPPTVSELTVYTKKLALLTVLSNESTNYSGVETLMSDSLKRGIVKKADQMFLTNTAKEAAGSIEGGLYSPPHGEPAGLVNTPGIVDGGAITSSINPLLETLGTLGDNGATPTAIIMGYGAWAKLLRLADANGRPLIAQDIANSPTPALYGIPVVLNAQAPKDTLLIIDKTEVLSSCGTVKLATSQDVFFDRDSLAVRVTFRFGFGVLHPNRLAKLTIGTNATGTGK
ncbi:phage major capsid protein [Bifidobacterium leontopitheci]|uniref:Major capsid protein n=1 Tax=Bifidobacterium leontopitheci TaxID=2650774 RepID=A0A6I1GLT0_9BIFI|nr:phage major capsid protein [Bifidobacterium leontopitheci]KAB7790556.1 major capsid protein [Bifidobacterium leontopitheci]